MGGEFPLLGAYGDMRPKTDDILKRTLCVEFTEFPEVDEAWLEDKVRAIRQRLLDRLGKKLEWGQLVTMPERRGIGLALLIASGYEHDSEIAKTVIDVVCEITDVVLPRSKGGNARRQDGLPQVGLGPRFPAEFYENRGQLPC